jgi:hypothetical protein
MAKKSATKKRKTKKQSPTNGTTKAQSIRDTAEELGKKTRPKHQPLPRHPDTS